MVLTMARYRTLLDFIAKNNKDRGSGDKGRGGSVKSFGNVLTTTNQTIPTSSSSKGSIDTTPSICERRSTDSKSVESQNVDSVSEAVGNVISKEEFGIKVTSRHVEHEQSSKLFKHADILVTISPSVNIENPRTVKFIRDRKEVANVKRAFLLDVDYDGERGKAVLILYDTDNNELVYWYDKTGHKPYFLTDLPPDKVSKMPEIVRHPSFEGVEVVEKIDLLYGVKRYFTKIVTKDPLAVRFLRSKVPIAWEADIRYHINYIYDRGLVPGIEYSIEGTEIREVIELDLAELKKQVTSILGMDEKDSETIELAVSLMKLFEARWFSPRRLAIDIEVYTPYAGRIPPPEHAEYPVISVAMTANDGLRKVLVLYRENIKVSKVEDVGDVDIEIFDSEMPLILETFNIISQYPIILSFNGDNFDFRYLYRRAQKLGIPKEHIPIRLKVISKGNRQEYQVKLLTGLHVDLYKFLDNKAIQAYAFEGKYKEVTLDAVAQALLGYGKILHEEDIGRLDLLTLVKYNLRDAELTLQLTLFSEELLWKLILLLMRISKLGLEDVTRTTVSVWIKNLFYWEHRRRGILIPRKEDIRRLKGKKFTEAVIKGKKYAGAIVIDPPRGVFFNVAVLDYASLYPSIIMRWNLSYETIDPPEGMCKDVRVIVDEKGNAIHKVCFDRPGITAQIVGLLRDFRVKIYKKKAKDRNIPDELRNWYDVVQRAMKVYINASYGVFGAETFPLYAPSVAESVTALGRRVIMMSIQRAEELGLKVLYGDTDSLFVWNPSPEALEELRKWVEQEFGLELEVDKVYKFVAFALKKNYIGVRADGSVDIKGMVGKKRNTPDFIKRLFLDIVNDISSIENPEDAFAVIGKIKEKLFDAYIRLRYKILTLDEVAFRVGLTKPLSEYKRSTPQHVKAALQLQRYGVQIAPGDVITFVKVRGKDGVKPIQLAKVAEIDPQKYLEAMKSALEQLFTPFNISWEEIVGSHRLI